MSNIMSLQRTFIFTFALFVVTVIFGSPVNADHSDIDQELACENTAHSTPYNEDTQSKYTDNQPDCPTLQ